MFRLKGHQIGRDHRWNLVIQDLKLAAPEFGAESWIEYLTTQTGDSTAWELQGASSGELEWQWR
jgi:hypothetical protein